MRHLGLPWKIFRWVFVPHLLHDIYIYLGSHRRIMGLKPNENFFTRVFFRKKSCSLNPVTPSRKEVAVYLIRCAHIGRNRDVRQKWDLVITDWEVLLTQGQCVWTTFCKIFSEMPHLTKFSTLKYAPKYAKYGQICQILNLGRVFWGARDGQVGYPWKELAKCSVDALTLCQ